MIAGCICGATFLCRNCTLRINYARTTLSFRSMQADPPLAPAPGPIDIHIDLSGLANLIWQSFIDHIGDLGTAIWSPFMHTLEGAARSVWAGVWGSSANI